MKKFIQTLFFCIGLTQLFSQSESKISTYLHAQYNHTLYDYTQGNNPWGIGLGLQTYFNNKTKFKPVIELTGDIYLEDNKVLKLNPDGSIPQNDNTVRSMVNLFAGSSFHPNRNIYLSFVLGPVLISGDAFLGIKPSVGFYFSKKQRWTGKISYINVFNREKLTQQDFGSLSVGVGFKLF